MWWTRGVSQVLCPVKNNTWEAANIVNIVSLLSQQWQFPKAKLCPSKSKMTLIHPTDDGYIYIPSPDLYPELVNLIVYSISPPRCPFHCSNLTRTGLIEQPRFSLKQPPKSASPLTSPSQLLALLFTQQFSQKVRSPLWFHSAPLATSAHPANSPFQRHPDAHRSPPHPSPSPSCTAAS